MYLPNQNTAIFFGIAFNTAGKKRDEAHAFVFMTNHIHIIISARKEETPLWHIYSGLQKFTAQKIIQRMQKKKTRFGYYNS